MTPIQQFKTERNDRVTGYSADLDFQNISKQWLSASMQRMYVYNFEWLGRPIIQYPQDITIMQEIIWKTRPDLIIETGIAHGGSLIFSASMLAMLDMCDAIEKNNVFDPKISQRKVIGIDIDIRSHNKLEIEKHPLSSRIQMFEGSSVDEETISAVQAEAKKYSRILVCLDSMHTHDHVLQELNAYANLVTSGSYCVVFDTFVEDMKENFFPDRPWNVGNNPKTAVHEWLKNNPEFECDQSLQNQLMITVCPDGFLKKNK